MNKIPEQVLRFPFNGNLNEDEMFSETIFKCIKRIRKRIDIIYLSATLFSGLNSHYPINLTIESQTQVIQSISVEIDVNQEYEHLDSLSVECKNNSLTQNVDCKDSSLINSIN